MIGKLLLFIAATVFIGMGVYSIVKRRATLTLWRGRNDDGSGDFEVQGWLAVIAGCFEVALGLYILIHGTGPIIDLPWMPPGIS